MRRGGQSWTLGVGPKRRAALKAHEMRPTGFIIPQVQVQVQAQVQVVRQPSGRKVGTRGAWLHSLLVFKGLRLLLLPWTVLRWTVLCRPWATHRTWSVQQAGMREIVCRLHRHQELQQCKVARLTMMRRRSSMCLSASTGRRLRIASPGTSCSRYPATRSHHTRGRLVYATSSPLYRPRTHTDDASFR